MKQSQTNRFYSLAVALVAVALFLTGISLASAATVDVYPGNEEGWAFAQETAVGSGSFVAGPVGGLGDGSANLVVDSTGGVILGKADYLGTPLADITKLEYSTYRADGGSALAPALQLNFDADLTDLVTTWQGRLVYEPYHTQTVNDDQWQTWNALNDAAGTQTGNWWFSNGTLATNSGCAMATPCTWAEVTGAFPDGGIHGTLGAVLFKAGGGWTGGFNGNVDAFTIGVEGVDTTYNFEATEPITDTDGDGVMSDVDVCEGTEADAFPQYGNKQAKNRFMWDGDSWETNAKPGTMGSFAPTIEDTKGCNGEQILDILTEITGLDYGGEYKFGITKGSLELFISGVYHVGPVVRETVEVMAEDADGTTSATVLAADTDYTLVARGTANAGDGVEFDADYSFRAASSVDWTDAVSSYEYYGDTLLDLMVNGGFVTWGDGTFAADHTYEYVMTGTGAPVTLTVYDVYYPGNTGSLLVDIVEDVWVDLW